MLKNSHLLTLSTNKEDNSCIEGDINFLFKFVGKGDSIKSKKSLQITCKLFFSVSESLWSIAESNR